MCMYVCVHSHIIGICILLRTYICICLCPVLGYPYISTYVYICIPIYMGVPMQVKSLESLTSLLRGAGEQVAQIKRPIAQIIRVTTCSEEVQKTRDRELERLHIQHSCLSLEGISKNCPRSADKALSEFAIF